MYGTQKSESIFIFSCILFFHPGAPGAAPGSPPPRPASRPARFPPAADFLTVPAMSAQSFPPVFPEFREFSQVFIPLFVAIDAFGLVPVFLAVTGRMTDARRRRVSFEAVGAALLISIGFMFLGNELFRLLGITDNDFRIAGGIILLVLAVLDLLIPGKPAVHEDEMVGIVPLAMPLIAGPATLTTLLVLASPPPQGHGRALTCLSLAVNFGTLLLSLLSAGRIGRWVGINGLRALSKLVMVFLAAIAVNFIRTGIMNVIRH